MLSAICFNLYQSKILSSANGLRRFKIYVADQKPQTIISFFSIYTKLCYRKRGLNEKEGLMTNSNTDFMSAESF